MIPLRYPIAPLWSPMGCLREAEADAEAETIHEQKQKGVGGGAAPYKGACAPLAPDRPVEDCT